MSGPTARKRLLVIDDSEAIHTDFRRILNPPPRPGRSDLEALAESLFGPSPSPASAANEPEFDVDSAYQGQEGVARILEAEAAGQPYALVFLDYRMPPGWNGAETLRRLREVAPSVRVVLCSAYTDYAWEELQREFGESHALQELRKPFNGQDVRKMALALTESSM